MLSLACGNSEVSTEELEMIASIISIDSSQEDACWEALKGKRPQYSNYSIEEIKEYFKGSLRWRIIENRTNKNQCGAFTSEDIERFLTTEMIAKVEEGELNPLQGAAFLETIQKVKIAKKIFANKMDAIESFDYMEEKAKKINLIENND